VKPFYRENLGISKLPASNLFEPLIPKQVLPAFHLRGLAADHLNNLDCIASLDLLVGSLDLQTLGALGNFNTGRDKIDGPVVSMSIARSLGSIPPNRREMLNSERLPQTRQ
jgi:hypothetical protein